MLQLLLPDWADSFVLTAAQASSGDRSELRRRIRRGDLVTVTRGVHLPETLWRGLDADGRYLALVRACALAGGTAATPPVFSHHSAAALWRLPRVGPAPERVHTTMPAGARPHSGGLVVRHVSMRPLPVAEVDGLMVTDLARTVIDLAALLPFGPAVAAADAALRHGTHPYPGLPARRLDREQLVHQLALLPIRQGAARARAVVDFADGLAQLPGESMSRVSMHLAGLPAPCLQVPLAGASGRVYLVDFWWPHCGLIGEFDGEGKYSEERYLGGRTTAQAHHDEKVREDDLRASGHAFSRWGWGVGVSPRRLRDHLVAAGLR